MSRLSLEEMGITVEDIRHNQTVAQLYEEAIRVEPTTRIADRGALAAYSGLKTGRSPLDKRIVSREDSHKEIWWGDVNIPMDERSFIVNRERAIDFLNTKSRLYVFEGFAGWDPNYRLKVRLVCTRPYHALFLHTMLIRPSEAELAAFGEPDLVILNAGEFPANRFTTGMTSKTSVDISFEQRQVVILGTEYAGEMKKGVFTVMNHLMPRQGVLSMHCGATASRETGRTSILFGMSGTGKTTLSADPKRLLIGDDEHCWTNEGVFNIEGGCYAKAIGLAEESEPDIYQALRFGAVLENVVLDEANRRVNFGDNRITENTRGAYPIEHVLNAKIPCVGEHPRDVIFLTCDAFGVLPPVARLNPAQAMYHFISGYTAKIAGTEVGVTEPQATFSPCFGGPFLVWHPGRYAELLAQRLREHGSNVWLVNTGWTGGAYGTGTRMKLAHTRTIMDAIQNDQLQDAPTEPDPVFGVETIVQVPGVPDDVLRPRTAWASEKGYEEASGKLAGLFRENFEKFTEGVTEEVRQAGPAI